ncbi:MAG: DUF2867 domain-containing protein [Ktedonobacteraceae bacterium]|nr:DUF2867 domain-containing protein [Ktedonobacteraceae bacterium]
MLTQLLLALFFALRLPGRSRAYSRWKGTFPMESRGLTYIRRIAELAPLLEHADHIDVKTVVSSVDMRTFLAGMLGYRPGWLILLYVIRAGFVRLLGMRQERLPSAFPSRPEDIPMQAGKKASCFTVRMAKEEHYWIAAAEDRHLEALLGVVSEPLPDTSQRRFHVLTVVHYRNWAGPVYFNVIRPFHHLVVSSMAKAGARRL